ncbi:Gfo/Idh/MocA family oxidoreductase [Streptomyces sp. GLT-R25]
MTTPQPLAVGLIGAGRMGSFHAETLARRLPGVRLAAVADPAPGAANQLADRLADHLGRPTAYTEIAELLADPGIEAVVISIPGPHPRRPGRGRGPGGQGGLLREADGSHPRGGRPGHRRGP